MKRFMLAAVAVLAVGTMLFIGGSKAEAGQYSAWQQGASGAWYRTHSDYPDWVEIHGQGWKALNVDGLQAIHGQGSVLIKTGWQRMANGEQVYVYPDNPNRVYRGGQVTYLSNIVKSGQGGTIVGITRANSRAVNVVGTSGATILSSNGARILSNNGARILSNNGARIVGVGAAGTLLSRGVLATQDTTTWTNARVF